MNYPTKIKGLSEKRRLIPKGKIRLGIKVTNSKGTEYPKETEYFACHEVPEVEKVYGKKPTELEIMFPSSNPDIIFPQAYECYGRSSGLKCIGDGETALRFDENREYTEVECKTPKECAFGKENGCSIKGHLKFFLPKVGPGLYQIDIGSINSIIDINSGLDWAKLMTNGDIAMKPFVLRRVPKPSHKNGKKQIHYTLQIELKAIKVSKPFGFLQELEEPEPPAHDINPALETKENGAVIEEEEDVEEEIKDESKIEERPKKGLKEKPKQKVQKVSNEIEPITARIYQTALKKGLNSWNEILVFAYRTSVFSADKSMTIDQFKEELEKDKMVAELLLSKITLITKNPGRE
jgi:hypothetical protein